MTGQRALKFGFLIDHRKCIGCHACSVACKEEHQVPLIDPHTNTAARADYWPSAWPGSEAAILKSYVHREQIGHSKGEYVLLPTFRLPTLIHTRSGNAKWLYEVSHTNPLWVHPHDAERLGLRTGSLAKVHMGIGYFVVRVWVTEAIRPGIVACSHHLGRWRLAKESGGDRWSTALVDLQQVGQGQWRLRQLEGIGPFASPDPDADRVWWKDAGVHQNLTFPVHPDPISSMHCWHQKVRVSPADTDDRSSLRRLHTVLPDMPIFLDGFQSGVHVSAVFL
jgi:anaerobic selenocysteine-containing dehydrogenase